MSRIGKLPIVIPPNVNLTYHPSKIIAKGPFGILQLEIPNVIHIIPSEETLMVRLNDHTRKEKALHGLYRTLIQNMVTGVSEQFKIVLLLKGVGYRAAIQNKEIILNLGYSHTVKIQIPESILVEITQNTILTLKSCDKEYLGLFASQIKSWREPEPYKGKGILYENEQIIRKAGKSAK